MSVEERKTWRIVRARMCIRAIMIFIGVLLVQAAAQIICVLTFLLWQLACGAKQADILRQLTEMSQSDSGFVMWVSLTGAVICILWCGILYLRSSWRQESFDYAKAFSVKNIVSVAGIGIGGCIVLSMVLTWIAKIVPDLFSSYSEMMGQLTDSSLVITVLYVLLAGPVAEELIFRGAILDRLYTAFPFLVANCLQAILFGIYHMNLIQGVYAFCLGCLLGMLRVTTGSILASAAAHILFNFTTYLLSGMEWENRVMGIPVFSLICILGAGLLCAGIWILVSQYKKK
ncbi:MAG: CPBP family intramembrane metalloprotease [Clostridiaceae bacterium]|nr:CPBP family intramembrane metalloprotease [Clostridiaceae bacterium]